jgi:uncharacterized membrane protein
MSAQSKSGAIILKEIRGDPSVAFTERWTPILFAVMALSIGALYGTLIPPLQIPDEGAHFVRAYGVSRGDCVTPADFSVPGDLGAFVIRYPGGLESRRSYTLTETAANLSGSMDETQRRPFENVAANLYSCVPYLPAAAAIGAGRLVAVSPAMAMSMGRAANLIAYVALTGIALWLLPDFHLLLFALALMPMTLHQAASLSADGLTISSTFLLTAYILRRAFGPQTSVMALRQHIILAGLIVFSSLCKFNIWLVLLTALIPTVRFGSRRNRWLAVAGYLALACIVAAIWQKVNWQHAQAFQAHLAAKQIFMGENLNFIFSEPVNFLKAFIRSFPIHGGEYGFWYVRSFVGHLAWLTVGLPQWLIGVYFIMIVAAACTQTNHIRLSWASRSILAVVAMGSFISVFALLFTFATSADNLHGPVMNGQGSIDGVQGRYFIPFAFVAFLTLSNTKIRVNSLLAMAFVACFCAYANYIGAGAIWGAFYANGR